MDELKKICASVNMSLTLPWPLPPDMQKMLQLQGGELRILRGKTKDPLAEAPQLKDAAPENLAAEEHKLKDLQETLINSFQDGTARFSSLGPIARLTELTDMLVRKSGGDKKFYATFAADDPAQWGEMHTQLNDADGDVVYIRSWDETGADPFFQAFGNEKENMASDIYTLIYRLVEALLHELSSSSKATTKTITEIRRWNDEYTADAYYQFICENGHRKLTISEDMTMTMEDTDGVVPTGTECVSTLPVLLDLFASVPLLLNAEFRKLVPYFKQGETWMLGATSAREQGLDKRHADAKRMEDANHTAKEKLDGHSTRFQADVATWKEVQTEMARFSATEEGKLRAAETALMQETEAKNAEQAGVRMATVKEHEKAKSAFETIQEKYTKAKSKYASNVDTYNDTCNQVMALQAVYTETAQSEWAALVEVFNTGSGKVRETVKGLTTVRTSLEAADTKGTDIPTQFRKVIEAEPAEAEPAEAAEAEPKAEPAEAKPTLRKQIAQLQEAQPPPTQQYQATAQTELAELAELEQQLNTRPSELSSAPIAADRRERDKAAAAVQALGTFGPAGDNYTPLKQVDAVVREWSAAEKRYYEAQTAYITQKQVFEQARQHHIHTAEIVEKESALKAQITTLRTAIESYKKPNVVDKPTFKPWPGTADGIANLPVPDKKTIDITEKTGSKTTARRHKNNLF
jgi:hypothetical protein